MGNKWGKPLKGENVGDRGRGVPIKVLMAKLTASMRNVCRVGGKGDHHL